MQTLEQIKKIRIELDSIANETKKVNLNSASKILYAKAWLGKLIGELNLRENPYGSDYHTKEDIVETQEKADKSFFIFDEEYNKKNIIEKTCFIRNTIQSYIDEIAKRQAMPTREANICATNVYNYLCEARFELGFYLEGIKQN